MISMFFGPDIWLAKVYFILIWINLYCHDFFYWKLLLSKLVYTDYLYSVDFISYIPAENDSLEEYIQNRKESSIGIPFFRKGRLVAKSEKCQEGEMFLSDLKFSTCDQSCNLSKVSRVDFISSLSTRWYFWK